MRVRNRGAPQLIDMLQTQFDERLQSLDTFVRRTTDREPVDESIVDQREVRSLFLSMTCHVVLRLHTLGDGPEFRWQVISRRMFEPRKMRHHAGDQFTQ